MPSARLSPKSATCGTAAHHSALYLTHQHAMHACTHACMQCLQPLSKARPCAQRVLLQAQLTPEGSETFSVPPTHLLQHWKATTDPAAHGMLPHVTLRRRIALSPLPVPGSNMSQPPLATNWSGLQPNSQSTTGADQMQATTPWPQRGGRRRRNPPCRRDLRPTARCSGAWWVPPLHRQRCCRGRRCQRPRQRLRERPQAASPAAHSRPASSSWSSCGGWLAVKAVGGG